MDLNEMLRNHLAESEPGPVMFPDEALARGRRTVRIRRVTAGVACAAVLAAGAAVAAPRLGSPDSQSDPASTEEIAFESPVMKVLQGGRSWVDWQYLLKLQDVEQTNACLADLGIDARQPLPNRQAIEQEALDLRYNTVIHDDAFRSAHGYGLVDGALDDRYAADRAWLRDVPDRGMSCTEPQADPEAAETAGLWMENMLTVQSQVADDPRVAAAIAGWEACMQGLGYSFSDPTDPSEHDNPWNWVNRRHDVVQGAEATAALAAEEVAIAQADWGCRMQELNETYDAVRIELETAFVAAHADEAEAARAAGEQLLGWATARPSTAPAE